MSTQDSLRHEKNLGYITWTPIYIYDSKGKSVPITGLEWPRGFQEVKVPRFRDKGTGCWKGCQPCAPAAFTLRKYSWYSLLLEDESTPAPKCDRWDFMSLKKNLTLAGIKPLTFRFVAQHLNHCATAVPLYDGISINCSWNEKYFRQKLCWNLKHILCSTIFSENCAIYEIVGKHMVEPDSPQMAV